MDSIANLDYLWRGKLKNYNKIIVPGNESRVRPLFGSGVYFLWNKGELQYIGQSTFVWNRLENHHIIGKNGRRSDWFIGLIPLDDDLQKRLHLESYCIKVFRPTKNVAKRIGTRYYRDALYIAATEAYEIEVAEPEMEGLLIGYEKDYFSKEDWIRHRVIEWLEKAENTKKRP